MTIFSLVSENGLGHYKRSIAVLDAILQKMEGVQITVACASWQIERMKAWDVSERFWKNDVQHLPAIVSPGVRWETKPEKYSEEVLLHWHKRMAIEPALQNADVVLSDNLPQVLHYRIDAIMLGSFLWSDVLSSAYPQNNIVKKFAEEEKDLLSAHHPYMICVDDMVMDGVVDKCRPVRMGWFCKKQPRISSPSNENISIAVLGGATGSFNKELNNLAQQLALKGIKICVPQESQSAGLEVFDYQDDSFRSLGAIICRPGIGTLTDAVKYGVPVMAAYESGNLEMNHNGSRIESLGIGTDLGEDQSPDEMCRRVLDFIYSGKLQQAGENIASRKDDGINESAEWIINHYKTMLLGI